MKQKFNMLNSGNETKNKIYYISCNHSDNETMEKEIEQKKRKISQQARNILYIETN